MATALAREHSLPTYDYRYRAIYHGNNILMALLHYMLLHALIIIAPDFAQGAHEASTYLLWMRNKNNEIKKKNTGRKESLNLLLQPLCYIYQNVY